MHNILTDGSYWYQVNKRGSDPFVELEAALQYLHGIRAQKRASK